MNASKKQKISRPLLEIKNRGQKVPTPHLKLHYDIETKEVIVRIKSDIGISSDDSADAIGNVPPNTPIEAGEEETNPFLSFPYRRIISNPRKRLRRNHSQINQEEEEVVEKEGEEEEEEEEEENGEYLRIHQQQQQQQEESTGIKIPEQRQEQESPNNLTNVSIIVDSFSDQASNHYDNRCSRPDLIGDWTYIELKRIESFFPKIDHFDVQLYAKSDAVSCLSVNLFQEILIPFFSNLYEKTNFTSCNKFYVFWCHRAYQEGFKLGIILCSECYESTLRENGVMSTIIQYIKPIKVFTVHMHDLGHYHCSWCLKDTAYPQHCELYRSHKFWSAYELWYTN